MTNESGSNGGDRPSRNGEAPHDVLGDTHLGRSLKELIREIRQEKDSLQAEPGSDEASGAGNQVSDAFDLSASRFDLDLEHAVSSESGAGGGKSDAPPPSGPSQGAGGGPAAADSTPGDSEVVEAMSGMEAILQRFAAAERRRCEHKLAEWKEQLKKATMIVIKKQVDAARAKWMQNQGANQAKVAEHYQKLKVLADRVAKQKAQIQKAKQELEQKLEVADRLHHEFDEIRNVLGGQIGAIDALDKDDGPADT